MTIFVKWFILNAVILTAIFLAEQKGAFSSMIENDASRLTILIMCLYTVLVAYLGKICYEADVAKTKTKKQALLNRMESGWFCAEHFFSLGLLGTIIGLCLATGESLDGTATVSKIVSGLKHGLNTAFYTTICGIVFSLLSQIQLMVIKQHLNK